MQALRGEDITIYGNGSQSRSFCYVEDLVDAMLQMMATPPDITGPINIGNPEEFSIRELAEIILEMTGAKSKLIFQALPSDDPRQRRPDISKAKAVLAWQPKIELREGLKKTIDYFDRLLLTGAVPALASRRTK